MAIYNAYGFSVDAKTGRVDLVEGLVKGFQQSIPCGEDHVTRGSVIGPVVNKTAKVGINDELNLVYIDIEGKEYTGTVTSWESLPHTEDGKLIMDSVGAITSTFKGLGFTEFGGVALLKQSPVIPGKATLISASAVSPTQINIEFSDPSTGTKPFNYIAQAMGTGSTIEVDPDAVAVAGSYFGSIKNCLPNMLYGVMIKATNAAGDGEYSNRLWVQTPASTELPAISSITGRTWDSDGYAYIYWTEAGSFQASVNKDVAVDMFIVGGGGGGHGQVIPFASGGQGGGGAIFTQFNVPLTVGNIKGNVGAGAQGGSTINGEWSTFGNFSALGGGTSLNKQDGTPSTDKTEVPPEFAKCAAFMWNQPTSEYVSGSKLWDKKGQPNGIVYGEGGGGTNGTGGDSKAGNGQAGIVCLRYKL